MYILYIEHPVIHYEAWKKTFDSDPMNRRQSGVSAFRIFRQVDKPDLIIIELEFNQLPEAEKMMKGLKELWKQAEGKIIYGPQARIVELCEEHQY